MKIVKLGLEELKVNEYPFISMKGVMRDRFGQEVLLVPVDETHFYVKQVGCSQSAVLRISDGTGGRRSRFPHRSSLENSADGMQRRLTTKILNLCGCSHILEIVFQTEDILLRRNAFLC